MYFELVTSITMHVCFKNFKYWQLYIVTIFLKFLTIRSSLFSQKSAVKPADYQQKALHVLFAWCGWQKAEHLNSEHLVLQPLDFQRLRDSRDSLKR